MSYTIRIKSNEHSEKVLKHLFDIGYKWSDGSAFRYNMTTNHSRTYFIFYPKEKRIFYSLGDTVSCGNAEVELIGTVSYELKEVKRKVVKVGELSYYEDELANALKNIKPI
jgi:hypothetical protein